MIELPLSDRAGAATSAGVDGAAGAATGRPGRARSLISLFATYAAERYPARRFALLALFLSAAALAVGSAGVQETPGGLFPRLALSCGLAYGLVFGFRLWDDVADRERDRREHPGRMIVAYPQPTPFALLAGAVLAAAGTVLAFTAGPARAAGLLGFCVLLGAWYRWRPTGADASVARAHVVLLKYPAIVLLIASPPTVGVLQAMWIALLVLAAFGIFEILHDPAVRGARSAGPVLALHMAAILVSLGSAAVRSSGLTAGVLALLGAAAAAVFLRAHRRRTADAGGGARTGFLFVLPILLTHALGVLR